MHDAEHTRLLIEEIKNLRSTVQRFGFYFVFLTFLGFAGAGYGYLRYREIERQLELSLAQFLHDRSSMSLPDFPSLGTARPVKATSPAPAAFSSPRREYSAPPKFPEGTRFVPDDSFPKGYRVVPGN